MRLSFVFFTSLLYSVIQFFIHKRRIISDSIIIEFRILMHIMLLFHFYSYSLSFPHFTNPYVFNSFCRLFIPFLFEVYSVVHFDYLIWILSFFCSFLSILFITYFLVWNVEWFKKRAIFCFIEKYFCRKSILQMFSLYWGLFKFICIDCYHVFRVIYWAPC